MAGFSRSVEEAEAKAKTKKGENEELRGRVDAPKADMLASAGEHAKMIEKLRNTIRDLKKTVRTTEKKLDDGKLKIHQLEYRDTAAEGEQEQLRLEVEQLCRSNKELMDDLADTYAEGFHANTRQVNQKFPDSGVDAASLSVIKVLEEQVRATAA